MSDDFSIPTAEYTLRIIELLLANPDGLSPQEMLAQLDVSRSSLFLLLRMLKNLGYIEQNGKRGKYRAGARLTAWRTPQFSGTQQILTAFYQETSTSSYPETLALLLPSPDGVMVIAQVETQHQIRSVFTTGQVYTGITSAEQVLSSPPPAEIVSKGYAVSSEWDSFNLAVPICKDGVNPVAALLLSAPLFRLSPETLTPELLADIRTLAARLSYRLGAVTYTPYQQQGETRHKPASPLSEGEINAFLKGPWTARLACIRPDGRPHVIPVWQEWDGRGFWVIAWKGSQWVNYVSQNPNVSLTIDEPWSPLRRVTSQGRCIPLTDLKVSTSTAGLERLVNRLMQRYLGQTASHELIERVDKGFYIETDSIKGWQGLPG